MAPDDSEELDERWAEEACVGTVREPSIAEMRAAQEAAQMTCYIAPPTDNHVWRSGVGVEEEAARLLELPTGERLWLQIKARKRILPQDVAYARYARLIIMYYCIYK
jgi:hypothetical protein